MFRQSFQRMCLLTFFMVVASAFFATSAPALPISGGRTGISRPTHGKERGLLSLLIRIFGKSGGAMDPNGGTSPVGE